MQPRMVICSYLLLLAACTSPPSRPVAVKQWTREEQVQIAAEHNKLPPDSILRPVLEDWERMRRELRE